MSTRSRILLALLALTLAPLLGVAAWACVHAVRWSPEAIQLRLARAAVQGVIDVRAARADATASLQDLADRIAAGGLDPAALENAVIDWPGQAHFASLRIEHGADVLFRSDPGASPSGCAAPAPAALTTRSDALRLVGELAPLSLLRRDDTPDGSPRLVVLNADGEIVADPWCSGAAGLIPAGAATMQSPAAFGLSLGEGDWHVVAVPGPSWLPAFPEAGLGLLLAAVFLALAATGAFIILVRDLWRSMAVLTTAADRIGSGDFSPWLPPPAHDEVGRLSFAIGTMAARLEHVMLQNARNRQMAAIGELASHVSHEIRNPLSSIKLNLQSVDRELRDGSVPADLPAVMRLCLREVNRLDGTVQAVLRLAGTGEPQLAPCSLHAVLREALETVSPQMETRGIEVVMNLDASTDTVHADAVQLRGVILNLLLNAHDALAGAATRRLEVRTEEIHGADGTATLRVRITDSGPGVDAPDRERIFQPFFTTKPTGTGIGLPLAARVMEAHGGRLYLASRSEAEAGAEFVIELPLRPVAPEVREERKRWRARPQVTRVRTPETVP